jgi:UDP-N-acetyl-D-mannosaminuronic acid dehydrogenase
MQTVTNIEIAELSKVIENTYRMIEIAFAEELKMFCDSEGINFEVLREAVNSKWNINILEARDGIKGHCLPKDSQMYIRLVKDAVPLSIAYSAKTVDDLYKKHISERMEKVKLVMQEVTT